MNTEKVSTGTFIRHVRPSSPESPVRYHQAPPPESAASATVVNLAKGRALLEIFNTWDGALAYQRGLWLSKPVPARRWMSAKSRPAQVAWLVVLAQALAMSANPLPQPECLPLLLLWPYLAPDLWQRDNVPAFSLGDSLFLERDRSTPLSTCAFVVDQIPTSPS